ncbi:PREDICTED: LRR receptor-like serine/threonine-protein kinase FLS2 [Erythranthe guttata]|nr:PREDICTED: LRR receptor-like serine/threonine-protein kinase FLS2 [Erythranthe guttata]|eukprot:XP_012836748.1 PREDICTED: LRR receptor-like serine/threonine-protein kinase FLS2 [Erythranthe guttata]
MTSLEYLDLSQNSYNSSSDFNPRFLLPNNVVHVDLSSNKLYHDTDWISDLLSDKCSLRSLQLNDNQLYGDISRVIQNLTRCWIDKLENLNLRVFFYDSEWRSMVLNQVMKGVQMEYTTDSKYVVDLDLSSNYFVGEIPLELTRSSVLVGLNLSRNHLRGKIPTKIGDLRLLESLDLSNNNLVEEIPESVSNLMFLNYLNLSNNNLSGRIPTGRQLQVLNDPSIYFRNLNCVDLH